MSNVNSDLFSSDWREAFTGGSREAGCGGGCDSGDIFGCWGPLEDNNCEVDVIVACVKGTLIDLVLALVRAGKYEVIHRWFGGRFCRRVARGWYHLQVGAALVMFCHLPVLRFLRLPKDACCRMLFVDSSLSEGVDVSDKSFRGLRETGLGIWAL